MFENILFATICWLCSLIFGGITFWAFKRKDPMHFWAGSVVKPDEISDVPSYNRANGLMWAIYTIFMILTGILSLFSVKLAAILMVFICIPGIVILIIAYNQIYNKYKKNNDSL